MKDRYEIERTCPTGSFAYTIKPGDTLFKLSQQFGVSVVYPNIDKLLKIV